MTSAPQPSHRSLAETGKNQRETSSKALPPSWVERIFAVMATHYGSKFADAWRGTDPDELKKAWAFKLGVLNPDQIKRGMESLDQCAFPPTLPEFIALCKQSVPRCHVLALPKPRLTAEQRDAGMRCFAEIKLKLWP